MEGVGEATYIGTINTAGTESIEELTGADPGSPAKWLKTFVPPDMETVSDPILSSFITKLQVHFNHSAEVIVGDQTSISLLKSKIGDVPEDHTTIWCLMGDIIKKFFSHVAVMGNLDLDSLMKEAR